MKISTKKIIKWLCHNFFVYVKYSRRPRRYRQLLQVARSRAPSTIIEIGVYNGRRASEMINAALIGGSQKVTYHGFDLFEIMNEDSMVNEFSKWPKSRRVVERRLSKVDAEIHLHVGFTSDTLPEFQRTLGETKIDMVFIDGGHSVETIRSDWHSVKRVIDENSVVIFDDFYEGAGDYVEKFGCNKVIHEIDPSLYNITIMDDEDVLDRPERRLRIRFVQVCPLP